MNKCCEDKAKHNLEEAMNNKPPFRLICSGEYSMTREQFYFKLLEEVPDDYKIAYMLEVFDDVVNDVAEDRAKDMYEERNDID